MKLPKALLIDCAVSDCKAKATHTANLSINNAPKKHLPVCKPHADAAREDWIVANVQREVGVQFEKITVNLDRRAVLDDLKRLNGLPPHNGFNPCAGDGYFAASLVKKYDLSIEELAKAVNFEKVLKDWKRAQDGFLAKH